MSTDLDTLTREESSNEVSIDVSPTDYTLATIRAYPDFWKEGKQIPIESARSVVALPSRPFTNLLP